MTSGCLKLNWTNWELVPRDDKLFALRFQFKEIDKPKNGIL